MKPFPTNLVGFYLPLFWLRHWARSKDPTKGLDVFALETCEIEAKRPLIPKWLIKQLKEASDANVFRYQDANVMMTISTMFYPDL